MNQFKPEVKALILIHTIMLVMVLVFTGLSYFVSAKIMTTPVDASLDKTLQLVAVVLSVAAPFAAFKIFNKKRLEWQTSTAGFDEKMNAYRAASIMKFALLESPILFSAVGYFLTQNIAFIFLATALIFIFAGQKPTVTLMTYDMNVSRDELFERS